MNNDIDYQSVTLSRDQYKDLQARIDYLHSQNKDVTYLLGQCLRGIRKQLDDLGEIEKMAGSAHWMLPDSQDLFLLYREVHQCLRKWDLVPADQA